MWFVGYTPNLATAAMIAGANSKGEPISLEGLTVGGETIYSASGSGIAGPMWGQAMGVVQQWLDDAFFTPPDPNALLGEAGTVPSVGGMSIASRDPDDRERRLQCRSSVPRSTPATPRAPSPTPTRVVARRTSTAPR